MRIDISSILKDEGDKLECNGSLIFSEFSEKEISLREPLEIQASLVNVGNGILVRGIAKGVVAQICSRCLADFPLPVEVQISEEYLPKSIALSEENKHVILEEFAIFTYDDHFLDLTEAVRQTLLLNLPMEPLCKSDCKGLCPQCGKNRNEGDCGCSNELKLESSENCWAPLQSLTQEKHLKKPLPKENKRRAPRG